MIAIVGVVCVGWGGGVITWMGVLCVCGVWGGGGRVLTWVDVLCERRRKKKKTEMCVLFLHCCELHTRFVPALSITCTFTLSLFEGVSRVGYCKRLYTYIHDNGVPFCWDHIELFPIFILLFLL